MQGGEITFKNSRPTFKNIPPYWRVREMSVVTLFEQNHNWLFSFQKFYSTSNIAGIMSNTGLEEKIEKINVEEKEAKGRKGSEKTQKGEKKKKEDLSAFPLEVSEFTIIYARLHVCVTPSNLSLIFQVFGKNGLFTFSTVLPVLLGMSLEKAHH